MNESKTLREIHKIMERLYEKRKNMTDEEMIKDINESAEQFMKKYNLKLRLAGRKILQKI